MLQCRILLSAAAASASATAAAAEAAVPAKVGLETFSGATQAEQREALRTLIRGHEAAVQRNSRRRDTRSSTYDEATCSLFPFYQLAALPPTAGEHRAAVRSALAAESGPLAELEAALLAPWRAAAPRTVVVFGCKSIPYLRRQLAADEEHSLLVVDHSLKALANAAAALVKDFGPRVYFVRSDAMFATLTLLPKDSVDTVVAPMPAPFWAEKGSHRRLVTAEFISAAHRILRERTDAKDPRGFVTFTDCEPYADFVVEQLAESKLLVPWARKNPQEAYGRWLPVTPAPEDPSSSAPAAAREFAQQRFGDVIAVAASKSGQTAEQALSFIESYNYKRRHYRAFNDGSF